MSTRAKLTCGAFPSENFPGTACIEFEKFAINRKHSHPKGFAYIKRKFKAKKERASKVKNDTVPGPRVAYTTTIQNYL